MKHKYNNIDFYIFVFVCSMSLVDNNQIVKKKNTALEHTIHNNTNEKHKERTVHLQSQLINAINIIN